MTATLASYIVQIRAYKTRDLDEQADKLGALQGNTAIDFKRGWWGDPDYFLLTFEASVDLTKTLLSCNEAIKSCKRVRSNEESSIYHEEFQRTYQRQTDRAAVAMGYRMDVTRRP